MGQTRDDLGMHYRHNLTFCFLPLHRWQARATRALLGPAEVEPGVREGIGCEFCAGTSIIANEGLTVDVPK